MPNYSTKNRIFLYLCTKSVIEMRRLFRLSCALIVWSLAISCVKEEMVIDDDTKLVEGLPFITAILGEDDDSAQPQTKTTFTYLSDSKRLKASWKIGDKISIVPDRYNCYDAGLYELSEINGSQGTFSLVDNVGATTTGNGYGIFYPGDRIKSTAQVTRFMYEGQVQSSSDPMAHLGQYHSMWLFADQYNPIDFSTAAQSSCMRVCLKGMTFDHPTKVEVESLNGSKFYLNNVVNGKYTYFTSDPPLSAEKSTSISVSLEGYGAVQSLEAWIMMSNADVVFDKDNTIRVKVYCSDDKVYCSDIKLSAATTLTGGKCHVLAISKGWKERVGDYTQYPWDGEVVSLQEGIEGLDIIIMGDGFIKEDFDNGTYDREMRKVYEEFFYHEPYATLKENFNVFYIKTPSPERIQAQNTGLNGAQNTGHVTKFSTTFTPNSTTLSGNNDLAREYAYNALGANADARIKDATIVVVANQACRAGTCHYSWNPLNGQDYGQVNSVVYTALGRSNVPNEGRELIHHEVSGHGFAKLADEYYYTTQTMSSQWIIELHANQAIGMSRNVDEYIDDHLHSNWPIFPLTTIENVYWKDLFGTSNNYEAIEGLGIYKGAYTYDWGFCRPTEDGSRSIMSSNRGFFNAPSRRQIYYRYRRLSGQISGNQFGSSQELQAFLQWDAQIIPRIFSGSSSSSAPSVDKRPASCLLEEPLPFAPPVVNTGRWEGGRFIKD